MSEGKYYASRFQIANPNPPETRGDLHTVDDKERSIDEHLCP